MDITINLVGFIGNSPAMYTNKSFGVPGNKNSISIIISIFLGYLGIDRFMLGDTTNGILKILLTICCGVGLIWWLVDIFKVDKMTRKHNYKLLKDTLKYV